MKKIIFPFLFFLLFFITAGKSQTWNPVGGGMNGYVSALYTDTTSHSLYAGGDFDTAQTSPANNIARWDETGWYSVGNGLPGDVYALTSYNGELVAAGVFTMAHGTIDSWNGSSWNIIGGGTNGFINTICVYNGELYAAGAFDTAGSVAVNYIAKWNGTSWSSAGTGLNDMPRALIVFNGELYVGGDFTIAGGNPANGIAKWDGSNWTSVGTGSGRMASSFGIFNNELYEGGIGANSSAEFTKWDGVNWTTVGGGISGALGSTVASMCIYNNTLCLGGDFSHVGSNMISANNIAQWDGVNWSALGSGMNSAVLSLANYNGILYAGGGFNLAGGNFANHIASWPSLVGINSFAEEKKAIDLFPNPANENLNVNFEITENQQVNIFVTNIEGKTILEINRGELSSGKYSQTIDVASLSKGIYFVKVQGEKSFACKKLIVE